MSAKQVLVSETMLAAIEARHNALESRIEAQDLRIDNLVENINLLRGDKQRALQEERQAAGSAPRRGRGAAPGVAEFVPPASLPKPQAADTSPGNGPVEVPMLTS